MPYPYNIYNQVFSQGLGQLAQALLQKWSQEDLNERVNRVLYRQDFGAAVEPERGALSPRVGFDLQEGGKKLVPTTPRKDVLSAENLGNILSLLQHPQGAQVFQGISALDALQQPKYEQFGPGTMIMRTQRGAPPTVVGQVPFKPEVPKPSTLWTAKPPEGQPAFVVVPGTNKRVGVKYLLNETGQYKKDASGNYITDYEAGGTEPTVNVLGSGGTKDFNAVLALRKEFRSTPEVLYFHELYPRFDTILSAYKQAEEKDDQESFVAVDQVLINMFNKMVEPGSVVREPEYIRTPEDMALLNRLKAIASRWKSGGRLEPQTRKDLLKMAKRIMDVAVKKYQRVRGDFEKMALDFNLKPEHVVGTTPLEGYKTDIDYSKLSDAELAERVKAKEPGAIREAKRRGKL